MLALVDVRLIALNTLNAFWERHPATKPSLERWAATIKAGNWKSTSEIQASFRKAKVLYSERVRFEVTGGNDRLIAAFKFENQIAFVKFVGTHAEYDRIDALSVSLF